MGAKRATCLLMILLVFATWISFAQATQGGILNSSAGKGSLDDEHAMPAAYTNKNWNIGGRKMVVDKQQQTKHEDDENMNGAAIGETSKFSSSRRFSRCGNHINLGCQQQTVNHHHLSNDEVDESGFVAFNADYHAPRHHPPKNN